MFFNSLDFLIHYIALVSRSYLDSLVHLFSKRAVRDFIALVLMICTWVSGVYCLIKEADFPPQYFFCMFLSLLGSMDVTNTISYV